VRDLFHHYEVWIRYRNGSEELRGRVNTRRFADQITRDLRSLPENLLAEVYTVRRFGVHPWTVRLLCIPAMLVASFIDPEVPRMLVMAVIAAVLLGAGAGGEKWIGGGPDDR
jgi:hypothetical protein